MIETTKFRIGFPIVKNVRKRAPLSDAKPSPSMSSAHWLRADQESRCMISLGDVGLGAVVAATVTAPRNG